jgi:hypothetical protein
VRFDTIAVVRGLAALVVLASTSACDLVFPPGHLAGDLDAAGGADALQDRPDGTPGTPDSPPGTPDATPDDAASDPDAELPPIDADTCALACLGNGGADGVTGCGPFAMNWCGDAGLATLQPYDLCGCTSGSPSVIVFDVVPGSMKLAFLPPFGNSYYLEVEGVGCFTPVNECAIDGVCGGAPAQLVYFDSIPTDGLPATFRIWLDDLCQVTSSYVFYYAP